MPIETGMCAAYFVRYGYNSTSQQCEEFIYGGCGGNENRFKSMEECRHACDPQYTEAYKEESTSDSY